MVFCFWIGKSAQVFILVYFHFLQDIYIYREFSICILRRLDNWHRPTSQLSDFLQNIRIWRQFSVGIDIWPQVNSATSCRIFLFGDSSRSVLIFGTQVNSATSCRIFLFGDLKTRFSCSCNSFLRLKIVLQTAFIAIPNM